MIDKVKEIKQLVNDLIGSKAKLETDHSQVLEELSSLKEKLESNEKELKELKQKFEVMELSSSIEGSGDNKALKTKIDKFIGEIDRCIDLMKRE